ncbi:hypothetical protein ACLKA6_008160 [Drosophila palustris]
MCPSWGCFHFKLVVVVVLMSPLTPAGQWHDEATEVLATELSSVQFSSCFWSSNWIAWLACVDVYVCGRLQCRLWTTMTRYRRPGDQDGRQQDA